MRRLWVIATLVLMPVSANAAQVTAASAQASCASIIAKANKSTFDMVNAALTYYHGMYMGQSCVAVDYIKAFALLKQAGDTSDAASLADDLRTKAKTGNPRAIAALEKLGLSH